MSEMVEVTDPAVTFTVYWAARWLALTFAAGTIAVPLASELTVIELPTPLKMAVGVVDAVPAGAVKVTSMFGNVLPDPSWTMTFSGLGNTVSTVVDCPDPDTGVKVVGTWACAGALTTIVIPAIKKTAVIMRRTTCDVRATVFDSTLPPKIFKVGFSGTTLLQFGESRHVGRT